jgi:RNA polymerase sigma factor (sigma-70 family)
MLPVTERTSLTEKTDHDLLRRYTDGRSDAAFAELVRRHGPMVYAACRRELYDRHLAEDATQVVFLLLARKAGSLADVSHVAGWLFRVARLAARNVARSERSYRRTAGALVPDVDRIPRTRAATGRDLFDEIEPRLNAALAALRGQDREPILLHYLEGRSWIEVGAMLGTTADTAQKRASRALETLRRRLRPAGAAVPLAVLASMLADSGAIGRADADSIQALVTARGGLSDPSLQNTLQGVVRTMAFQKLMPLIAAAALLTGAAALRAIRPAAHHSASVRQAALPPSDPAATGLMAATVAHYQGLSTFSMDVENSDSSGLYPGQYAQHLQWSKGGVFTLTLTRPSTAPPPVINGRTGPAIGDFSGDGSAVTATEPGGQSTVDPEAPQANNLPEWEVSAGLILSWLQHNPAAGIPTPPPGVGLALTLGPRTVWRGSKVREIVAHVAVGSESSIGSYFVDPQKDELVGMEWRPDRTNPGLIGYAQYLHQRGR